jgi:hypothetical protein
MGFFDCKYRLFLYSYYLNTIFVNMSTLIINGHDIEPYFPRNMSDDKKQETHKLTLSIIDAVDRQLPIGFSYHNSNRLILPHSAFLQNETPSIMSVIKKPRHIRTKMRFYSK